MHVDKNPYFCGAFYVAVPLIGAFLAEDRIIESLRHRKVFGHQNSVIQTLNSTCR